MSSRIPFPEQAPAPETESCWTSKIRFIQNRSEEHTSELQSQSNLVCRLLLEKKKHSARNDQSFPPSSAVTSLVIVCRLITWLRCFHDHDMRTHNLYNGPPHRDHMAHRFRRG